MTVVNEKTSEILNDLIEINNDRVRGYEKASKETEAKDADLRTLFDSMASESRRYANELSAHVAGSGHEPAEGTTVKGKIYRAWMDIKATFSGHDRKAILASCEFGEDAAQKAYDTALKSDAEISTEVRQLIMEQKTSLRKSHDKIKRMRDAQPA
jgi:uncharacterized protein (TIGR02284 family)